MARRLASATIVQQQLYVERQADRQLDTAIDDMGRPPYVLVARQMGKTNLLINMKRKREQVGDVVSYFDLSSRLESARSFFRSIVDGLLEQIEANLGPERDQIDALRRASYEPTTEYERSLRLILRGIGTRKLVVVFDEVDSLIKVSYSDVIFSHIRSIYFLRVNHAEYWRLTYVLSGVAEPATLIKDKNISPFNIGEKIYLSDFSRREYATFLEKAGISIDDLTQEEIFRLTGGNPRMTWDISARVEDIILSGGAPTAEDVRQVARRLYLTSFDTPPIDHIRTLVEEDPQLRSAVVAIRNGQQIESTMQSKLYLAGITAADTGGGAHAIKNPIIDQALSDEWLQTLPVPQEGILTLAREAFDAGNFQGVVDALAPHSAVEWFTRNAKAKEQLAYSLFTVGQFSAAVPLLEEVARPGEVADNELSEALSYYLGVAYQKVGEYDKSVTVLRRVYDGGGRSSVLAALALASSLIWLGNLSAAQEFVSVDVERRVAEMPDGAATLAVLHFNQGRVAELRGDPVVAMDRYSEALAKAPRQMSVAIQMQMSEVAATKQERSRLVRAAGISIAEEHIPLVPNAYFDISFQSRHLLRTLNGLLTIDDVESFNDLLRYAKDRYGSVDDGPATFLLRLIKKSAGEEAEGVVSYLLEQVSDGAPDLAPDKALEILRMSAELGPFPDRTRARDMHRSRSIRLLKAGYRLANEDLVFLLVTSAASIQGGRPKEALPIVETLVRHLGTANRENALLLMLARTHEMTIAKATFDRDRALSAAREVLSLTESYRGQVDEDFEDAGVTAINARDQAEAVIDEITRPLTAPEQLERERILSAIGRNDIVSVRKAGTEEIQTTKYKRVRDKLLTGELILEKRIVKIQNRTRGRRR